jgi:peptidyl-tRNA hydrolase, PTH1 family
MEQPVALVVGLGNPGADYVSTRHNAGFWFAEALATRFGGGFKAERKFQGDLARIEIDGQDVRIFKPMAYMNRSGQPVRALMDYLKIVPESVLVAHDDLDLPPGTVRLKWSGGHGGHNGLRDLSSHIGRDFRRARLGIGHPGDARQVIDYVLKRPSADDRCAILDAVDAAVDCFPEMAAGRFEHAMHVLHTRA